MNQILDNCTYILVQNFNGLTCMTRQDDMFAAQNNKYIMYTIFDNYWCMNEIVIFRQRIIFQQK